MTSTLLRHDLDILGEHSVYPGHPAVIAYLIMRLYEGRLDEAFDKGREFPGALENCGIPGAGGNVYSGLYVIDRVRDGMPPEASLRLADDSWAGCDNQRDGWPSRTAEHNADLHSRWQEGQGQAHRFRERVVEELRKVTTPAAPPPETEPLPPPSSPS